MIPLHRFYNLFTFSPLLHSLNYLKVTEDIDITVIKHLIR